MLHAALRPTWNVERSSDQPGRGWRFNERNECRTETRQEPPSLHPEDDQNAGDTTTA